MHSSSHLCMIGQGKGSVLYCSSVCDLSSQVNWSHGHIALLQPRTRAKQQHTGYPVVPSSQPFTIALTVLLTTGSTLQQQSVHQSVAPPLQSHSSLALTVLLPCKPQSTPAANPLGSTCIGQPLPLAYFTTHCLLLTSDCY